MDEQKIISDFITAQLTQLHASAVAALPEDSNIVVALQNALTEIQYGAREHVIPAGLTEETYRDFIINHAAEAFPDSSVEELQAQVTDVVGSIPDGNGGFIEIGSVEESAAAANGIIAAYEEEMGEVHTDNLITISYKRLNGEELSEAQVKTILDRPESASLKHLGNVQLLEISDTDEINEKKAVFVVLEEGQISLKTLALNVASYRGTVVFPGIGAVLAVGSVNYVQ